MQGSLRYGSPGWGDVGLEEKVAFLLDPAAYARIERLPPTEVRSVETHMAWVFLTDRHAWKLKKPVSYPFLDFSTVEARRRDGLEEVALNARLAPGVYLGVVPLIVGPSGALALGWDGPAVDWVVQMRRLPEAAFLDRRLRFGGVSDDEIAAVADLLARFYAAAPPVGISGDAYSARLGAAIVDDVEELGRHDHHADGAEDIGAALVAFIDANGDLLAERAGQVVEGHGDLRPEHVCLDSPPVVIDCLEFNQDFRIVDPVDELAFLAMECEMIGAPAEGAAILRATCERLGNDPPESLVGFYAAGRALLRAKLALSHVWDVEWEAHERWRARGRAYLNLARRHLPP